MGRGREKPVPERTAEEKKKINHKCLSKSQWRDILGENLGEERQCDRMSQVKSGVIEGETGNSGSKRQVLTPGLQGTQLHSRIQISGLWN